MCQPWETCWAEARSTPHVSHPGALLTELFEQYTWDIKLRRIRCCLLQATPTEGDVKVTLAALWLAGSKHPYRSAAQWQWNEDPHTCKRNLGKKTSWGRKGVLSLRKPLSGCVSHCVTHCCVTHSQEWRRRRKKWKPKGNNPHLLLMCVMISRENASVCEPTLAPPLAEDSRSPRHLLIV